MIEHIIGVDPGHTTGYVQLNRHSDGRWEAVDAREIIWDRRLDLISLIAYASIRAPQPLNAVVVESFRLYPHLAKQQIGNDFPSVRVIGIVEAALHLYHPSGIEIITYYPASEIARVQPPVEWYDGGSQHIRDACAHARLFLLKRKLI